MEDGTPCLGKNTRGSPGMCEQWKEVLLSSTSFASNNVRRTRTTSIVLNEMKFLAVHPSCLMYSKICLRLESLGLELVAAAAERAGYSARLIDLQCESHRDFFRSVQTWRPDVIAFSGQRDFATCRRCCGLRADGRRRNGHRRPVGCA